MEHVINDLEDRSYRRRSTDTDGMPWQVKALGFIGVPSAIALYLVYSLVSGITPAVLSMQSTMSTLVISMNNIALDHAAAKQQNEQILRVLRASCVNSATDNEARERCLR